MGSLAGVGADKVGTAEKREGLVAALFNSLATAVLPIHQDKRKRDSSSSILNRVDGLKCRSARRNYVINHHHGVALGKVSFDQFMATVSLRLLSHRKVCRAVFGSSARAAIPMLKAIGSAPRGRPADRVNLDPECSGSVFDKLPPDLAHQTGTPRIHGGQLGIDVEITRRTGGEHEIPLAGGFFGKELPRDCLVSH
jgi:hypothetical protein